MEHTEEVLHHEGHVHHDAAAGKKEVIKITIYLSILTILELIVGYYMYSAKIEAGGFKSFLKTLIIIMMMWKATYIVGYFMHLKHEVRNFLMTIMVPLFLFVWFILAFVSDGHSYNSLKNQYDKSYEQRSKVKMEVKEHEAHESEHPAGEEKTGELH